MKRIRFLYVIFAVLVLASVGPLLFHSTKMLSINRQALKTNEQELQNTTTRSIADEIAIYNENFHQVLENLDRVLQIYTFMSGAQWDARSAELRVTLERFVNPANHILYVTYLDAEGRGAQAGNYMGESDPFMVKMLQRAFAAAQQHREYQSDPVLMSVGHNQFPAMLMSMPILRAGTFHGMVAVVVDLQFLVARLQSSSTRLLQAFIIDRTGRLVLTPDLKNQSIGEDMSSSPIVQMFLSKGGDKAVATSAYEASVGGQTVAMLGTYCPVPSLGWAVVAQKKQSDAYAAVDDMIQATLLWGAVALLMSLGLSYFLSLRIVDPIRVLTDASRRIAKGDLTARVNLRSRTEIGELASTFNSMSAEMELHIQQLKDAAERNRKLFLDSIRMIATAVDEKDPYTHGHSERVSRYSAWIAKYLGLTEEEVEKIRISALLHDVGKIGIEDRILKKPGVLTKEEFHIMMQHTQKGATIARRVEQLAEMVPGIELHHESLDGNGYPFGLRGEEIPLMARIIAVADTFDAMTTNRPYQTALETSAAIEYIASLGNKKYDPQVVQALQAAFDAGELRVTRAAALV